MKCWPCCSARPHDENPPPSIPTNVFVNSMKPIIEQLSQSSPSDQIDSLIEFINYLLRRIDAPPEEASSSSLSMDSVASYTRLAADSIDKISTEVQKAEDVLQEIGTLALEGLRLVGEAHWVFLGLSLAASALERCVTVSANVSECIELLKTIASLAKDLKEFREVMPGETDRLSEAVQIIVEGSVMCCGYIGKGKLRRYWTARTAADQVEKTKQSINYIRARLDSAVGRQILRQTTFYFEQSPYKLLDFEPLGIESQVAKVTKLLDMEGTESAVAVVLCGFGGVGKSTIAASAIQSLNWPKLKASPDFKYCRVKINYKTQDEDTHIIELQQYIINSFEGRKINVQNPDEGRNELQKTMENKFCFLYIDNVVDKKYIRKLLPQDLLWFNKSNQSMESMEKQKTKLRILVTSREKNLKPEFNIHCKEYEVHALSDQEAEKLLRANILQSDGQLFLDFDEKDLMSRVARACRGVPLILSIYGRHLRVEREDGPEKAKESYGEALKALEEGEFDSFREEEIIGTLFFVYHKLGEEEDKDAFLDICKYFNGWEWDLVGKIVDPFRLESLHRRMLVNKSDSGDVIVHDILRLMGVNEAKDTRVSNYEEFAKADPKTLKGISLVGEKSITKLKSTSLESSDSLRVLMIGDWVEIDGRPSKKEFRKLRYLSVGDSIGFPFEDVAKLLNLRVFSNRSKRGMNLPQLPPNLKFLSQQVADPDCQSLEILPLQPLCHLQNFIVEARKPVQLPNEFHLPASLVDLQFNCCSQVPKDFSYLSALQRLTLHKCDVECLSLGFGELKKLKHLSIEHCTRLTSLPEKLGLLSSLTTLRLRGCTLLGKLPVDLGELSALEELCMGECENLRELPINFDGLTRLQKLDLTGCIRLEKLPESFQKLRVESLTLQSLSNLGELPKGTGCMTRLTHLKLISCNSLTTLPSSFVRLSCLQSLEIDDCIRLAVLPKGFHKLSSLKEITLRDCPKLPELPPGFEALPALKSLQLISCRGLYNLPDRFGELKCLEFLRLDHLDISCLPDGFGRLYLLETLEIIGCPDLVTLPEDFENLPSLTGLRLWSCCNLNGIEMERIVTLKRCYWVTIAKSIKLIERWEDMRMQEEHPKVVVSDGIGREGRIHNLLDAGGYVFKVAEEELCRSARVSLLAANCIQPSISSEHPNRILFEVDKIVAVIALPVHVEIHHYRLAERLVGVAMEKLKNMAGTGCLQIVYVKSVKHKGEITEDEKHEEEVCFRKISKSMLEGSCFIPSIDIRCHRLITSTLFDNTADSKLCCRMLKMGVDDEGYKNLQFIDFFGEDDVSGVSHRSTERAPEENKNSNSVETLIKGICAESSDLEAPGPSQSQPKLESTLTMFLQTLKENKADHLIVGKQNKVKLHQLMGNVVGVFICDRNTHEYARLEQVYKELKVKGSEFEVLWIPLSEHEFYGLGTYTRALQNMIWTALPDPNLVRAKMKEPHLIIFDDEGNLGNPNALLPMMSWGADAYPFTKSKMKDVVSTIQSESIIKLLFHKINTVNKETGTNKLNFIYAEPPNQDFEMQSVLNRLTPFTGNFEITYVGCFFMEDYDISTFKTFYENATQKLHWPKLSFEEMITFWYRCMCLYGEMKNQTGLRNEELQMLLEFLCFNKRWFLVLDVDGIVTRRGHEVVDMMCENNDNQKNLVDGAVKKELLKGLEVGKFNEIVKTYFKDTIKNFQDHEHPLLLYDSREATNDYECNKCNKCSTSYRDPWYQQRRYRCNQCDFDICQKCWKVLVEFQIITLYKTVYNKDVQ